jgi:hypothetical protein
VAERLLGLTLDALDRGAFGLNLVDADRGDAAQFAMREPLLDDPRDETLK